MTSPTHMCRDCGWACDTDGPICCGMEMSCEVAECHCYQCADGRYFEEDED